MAQGGKRLLLGDQVHEYRAGQCLVVTANLPVTGHYLDIADRHPSLAMALVLRPPSSPRWCCEARRRQRSRTGTGISAMATGEARCRSA